MRSFTSTRNVRPCCYLYAVLASMLILASYITRAVAAPTREVKSDDNGKEKGDSFQGSGFRAVKSSRTVKSVNTACPPGSEERDICEKCAKVTKDVLVYPLCCEGSVNARNWCYNYLTYTLPKY